MYTLWCLEVDTQQMFYSTAAHLLHCLSCLPNSWSSKVKSDRSPPAPQSLYPSVCHLAHLSQSQSKRTVFSLLAQLIPLGKTFSGESGVLRMRDAEWRTWELCNSDSCRSDQASTVFTGDKAYCCLDRIPAVCSDIKLGVRPFV